MSVPVTRESRRLGLGSYGVISSEIWCPDRGDAVALACVLVPIGFLYGKTAAWTVLGEDNGEFCALYAAGGVAHPSGYPLYVLLLRAFSWLPVATPARGAALVTAGIALAGLAFSYAACRSWGAGRSAAVLACVLYATSPLAWGLATKAEVFALNAALAAAILVVGSPSHLFRGVGRAALLGLLVGLGLSNHHSIVLLAPLFGWAAVEAVRESPSRHRAVAALLGGFGIGLLSYATLPLAARSGGWVWGDVTTASGVASHFLRRDFGTTELAIRAARPSIGANLSALARTLFVDSLGIGCIGGIGVLAFGVGRFMRGLSDRRWRALAALATSFVLAGPFFAALMNVELSPEGTAIVRRFHLLPMLLLVVPFALGADVVFRRARIAYRIAAIMTTLLAGTLFGAGPVLREHEPMLESYLLDTLRTAPRNAVLLGSGDERVFGVLYEQLACGIRRDVVFVSPILLEYDWYRRRVGQALGLSLSPPEHGSVDTVALAFRLLGTGRRLFLTDVFSDAILRRYATYPIGTLIEVLPPGVPSPSPADVERQNLDLFATYHVNHAVLDVTRAWSRGARDSYARPWRSLAMAFEALGDGEAAARSRQRETLRPWAFVGTRD